MKYHTHIFLSAGMALLCLCSIGTPLSAKNKAQKKTIARLQADIGYLASDSLEGRRTGTKGEKLAAAYIQARYQKLGIAPYKGHYDYPFTYIGGRELIPGSFLEILGTKLSMPNEAFAFAFSGNLSLKGSAALEVSEQGSPWIVPFYQDTDEATNPHLEPERKAYDMAKNAIKGGATALILYDAIGSKYAPTFNAKNDYDSLTIPVIFINNAAYKQYIYPAYSKNPYAAIPFNFAVGMSKIVRNGINIAAYIPNNARYTVIVGAHFDHLGYGEDGNSLYAHAKSDRQIHHGADDNASGTAALMEIAKRVKEKKLKNFNYLFLHFSGEELGLIGSKNFIRTENIDSNMGAYMLNMDMVGRLNDSTNALTLGGVGTAPEWSNVVEEAKKQFKVIIDSTGYGPSDHTGFYQAGLPVLFLFTGQHKDYHKPTDIAENINYAGEAKVIDFAEEVIAQLDKGKKKPGYLVTKNNSPGKVKFKVTLGIMPDYSYQDIGVRIDGVSDGRPAAKAGLKTGDVILQLGDVKVLSMSSYMEALGKFSPGDVTVVTISRNGKTELLSIVLEK